MSPLPINRARVPSSAPLLPVSLSFPSLHIYHFYSIHCQPLIFIIPTRPLEIIDICSSQDTLGKLSTTKTANYKQPVIAASIASTYPPDCYSAINETKNNDPTKSTGEGTRSMARQRHTLCPFFFFFSLFCLYSLPPTSATKLFFLPQQN